MGQEKDLSRLPKEMLNNGDKGFPLSSLHSGDLLKGLKAIERCGLFTANIVKQIWQLFLTWVRIRIPCQTLPASITVAHVFPFQASAAPGTNGICISF